MARMRIVDDEEEDIKANFEMDQNQQEVQEDDAREPVEPPSRKHTSNFDSIMNEKDYQFDSTVDSFIQNFPDTFDIPDSIPILPTVKRSIQHLSSNRGIKMLSILKDLQKKLVKSVEVQLINRMSTEKDSLDGLLEKSMDDSIKEIGLENSVKAIDALCELEAKVMTSDESVDKLKSFFKPSGHQADFSLETLTQCINPERQNFLQKIEDKYNSDSESIIEKHRGASKSTSLVARQHIFVILHPTEPLPSNLLPNSEDEEGDLEVSGGTVELLCPISKTLLTDPVIAPCGHTFSKNEIMQYIKQSPNCPIPGCNKTFSAKNLKPDILMRLRVSSYEAQKESEMRKRRKNLEIVF